MQMKTKRFQHLSIRLGVIGLGLSTLGLLLSCTVTLYQVRVAFEDQIAYLNLQQEYRFEMALWRDQRDTYTKVCNMTGAIVANLGHEQSLDTCMSAFYTSYWGDMLMVDDLTVRKAIQSFHLELQDYLEALATGSDLSSPDKLKVKSKALTEACRASSEKRIQELRRKQERNS